MVRCSFIFSEEAVNDKAPTTISGVNDVFFFFVTMAIFDLIVAIT